MSLTTVIALNAVADVAIVLLLTAVMRIPYLAGRRRPAHVIETAHWAAETPLDLAA